MPAKNGVLSERMLSIKKARYKLLSMQVVMNEPHVTRSSGLYYQYTYSWPPHEPRGKKKASTPARLTAPAHVRTCSRHAWPKKIKTSCHF